MSKINGQMPLLRSRKQNRKETEMNKRQQKKQLKKHKQKLFMLLKEYRQKWMQRYSPILIAQKDEIKMIEPGTDKNPYVISKVMKAANSAI